MTDGTIDRRDFLKGAVATAALLFTAEELLAVEATAEAAIPGPPVKFGVVGVGEWARKSILPVLSRLPSAQITAICDTYEPCLSRAKEIAPSAATLSDYRKLLESPDVEAVVVATPSYLHKDIALAAVQAGKHVYCESPLATTIEDAKAIALAGQGSKQVFQAGLQGRSNAMYRQGLKSIKAGELGDIAQVYTQANNRDSLRRVAPTPERERELNWRVSRATSPGLLGEIGIHNLDLVSWYLGGLPTAVIGSGAIMGWKDGRDVPDTVQCIFEYPNNIRAVFLCTIVSSFSSAYAVFQGSKCSLVVREKRGWITKEAEGEDRGWLRYATKEPCFGETGYCIIAGSTALLKAGKEPSKEGSLEPEHEAIYLALENFICNIKQAPRSGEDEVPKIPGPVEGYQAAVAALKANEAVLSGSKIAYQSAWFDLK